MPPALQPIPPNLMISRPHTKIRRLFQEAAVRGGDLCTWSALARALGLSNPRVTQLFGPAAEHAGSVPPEAHVGVLVRAFNAQGVPLRLERLYQPLDLFDACLTDTRDAVAPIVDWKEIVWRHARPNADLRYERATRGLRETADARRELQEIRIGERVRLSLNLPTGTAGVGWEPHVVLILDDTVEIACLCPPETGTGRVASEGLRLPEVPGGTYTVTGPAGIQRTYAVLTRSAPRSRVHSGLADAELRVGLDVLASELAASQSADWRLYSTAVQISP